MGSFGQTGLKQKISCKCTFNLGLTAVDWQIDSWPSSVRGPESRTKPVNPGRSFFFRITVSVRSALCHLTEYYEITERMVGHRLLSECVKYLASLVRWLWPPSCLWTMARVFQVPVLLKTFDEDDTFSFIQWSLITLWKVFQVNKILIILIININKNIKN